MDTSLPTIAEAEKLNLTSKEFEKIKEILNRHPNALELEVFSLMWSEHASYKHSLTWLKTLPVDGDKVLIKAGDESAGAIDLGNGYACVLKVESHNHPCAIQPRLGANTGLRVATRDVTVMGAKPVAILSSLRFGEGRRDTARWLFDEVSNGISEFEKGMQVPVVGGETVFSKGYNSSPVINNMVVGVSKTDELLTGTATGTGNLIVVIGALTGKDGVDNDVFAITDMADIGVDTVPMELLMDVSVERSLIDAVQELKDSVPLIGVQTVGTHGIVGAVCEMAVRGKSGVHIETTKVPARESGLDARDVLLSQTWSRVLLCIEPTHLAKVESIAKKHKLSVDSIGEVIEGNDVICAENGQEKVHLPAKYLGLGTEAPVFELPYESNGQEAISINLNHFDEPDHYPDVVKRLIANLNVASKRWLLDKFDKSIKKEGNAGKYPSDAAYVDLADSNQALALTMDCNSSYMNGDAFLGAQIAVAEAARNIICAGGTPLAVSDCLNFGNPHDSQVYGTFVNAVKGITKACNDFKIPVISGNVSFHNQRSEEGQLIAITPTPVIGMVGILEDKKHHSTLSFKHKGDMIFLVGESRDDINGSEFAASILNITHSIPPHYNLETELEVQKAITGLIRKGLVRSVHDVSNGGLFFTLLESAIPLEFGFDITSDAEIRKEAFLFGESQSRVVVSVAPAMQDDFVDYMMELDVPFSVLGHVTKGEIRVDDESYGFIDDLKKNFEQTLKKWVQGK